MRTDWIGIFLCISIQSSAGSYTSADVKQRLHTFPSEQIIHAITEQTKSNADAIIVFLNDYQTLSVLEKGARMTDKPMLINRIPGLSDWLRQQSTKRNPVAESATLFFDEWVARIRQESVRDFFLKNKQKIVQSLVALGAAFPLNGLSGFWMSFVMTIESIDFYLSRPEPFDMQKIKRDFMSVLSLQSTPLIDEKAKTLFDVMHQYVQFMQQRKNVVSRELDNELDVIMQAVLKKAPWFSQFFNAAAFKKGVIQDLWLLSDDYRRTILTSFALIALTIFDNQNHDTAQQDFFRIAGNSSATLSSMLKNIVVHVDLKKEQAQKAKDLDLEDQQAAEDVYQEVKGMYRGNVALIKDHLEKDLLRAQELLDALKSKDAESVEMMTEIINALHQNVLFRIKVLQEAGYSPLYVAWYTAYVHALHNAYQADKRSRKLSLASGISKLTNQLENFRERVELASKKLPIDQASYNSVMEYARSTNAIVSEVGRITGLEAYVRASEALHKSLVSEFAKITDGAVAKETDTHDEAEEVSQSTPKEQGIVIVIPTHENSDTDGVKSEVIKRIQRMLVEATQRNKTPITITPEEYKRIEVELASIEKYGLDRFGLNAGEVEKKFQATLLAIDTSSDVNHVNQVTRAYKKSDQTIPSFVMIMDRTADARARQLGH